MNHRALRFFFSSFRFSISALGSLSLPKDKAFLFRHSLAAAARKIACFDQTLACSECLQRTTCHYFYLFVTPGLQGCMLNAPRTGEAHSSQERLPHPFVLEPPLTPKQRFCEGEKLCLQLVLIGRGIHYLPYFILSLERLGWIGIGRQRGKFRLDAVEDTFSPDATSLLYNGETRTWSHKFTVRNFADIEAEAALLNPTKLRLLFLTPTRLKQRQDAPNSPVEDGKKADSCRSSRLVRNELDFPLFVRSLLRRLVWLAETHCSQKWELDFQGLLRKARQVEMTRKVLSWYDWGRYSSHQQTVLKMGGFVGEATFEGNLKDFLPFVKLGEYVHVGNGTAYGLGKYQVFSDAS